MEIRLELQDGDPLAGTPIAIGSEMGVGLTATWHFAGALLAIPRVGGRLVIVATADEDIRRLLAMLARPDPAARPLAVMEPAAA